MSILIILTKQHYEDILSHSRGALPNEACGLLGGTADNETKHVKKVYLLANASNRPDYFSMDPKEQFAAVKDIRKNGWVLLGNFHSHPESPSRPSEEDKKLAFDPQSSYLILSLMDENNAVLKSFNVLNGVATEEALIIEGE